MNDHQPPAHERYPADEPDGGTAASQDDAPRLVTPATSTEDGVFGRQAGDRHGTRRELSSSALDLRPYDLAEHRTRSILSAERSYGPTVAGPWQEDGAANASRLAESIVATTHQALVVLDAGLHVRQANLAFYDLFQVGREETEHRDFFDLGGGQWDIPWLRASLIRILDLDNRLQVGEVERAFPEIGFRTMRLEARPLVGPGADDLILLAIDDITEARAAEQQQRDFILLLAHELRNPLTAIMGYAQRMQGHKGSVEETLAVIMTQARQLNRIVDDLLDGSRQGAEHLRLEPRQMDLVALARVSAQHAQLLEPRHTVRLELPEEPLEGLWDGGRLMQVFANLLGNAVKFSPPGSEIVMRVKNLETMAQVSIQDQGVGIASAEIPHLFDQLYRVGATAHDVPGLGLGLHVARRLVEAHGGSIAVESVPGLGSTFRVTLPR